MKQRRSMGEKCLETMGIATSPIPPKILHPTIGNISTPPMENYRKKFTKVGAIPSSVPASLRAAHHDAEHSYNY